MQEFLQTLNRLLIPRPQFEIRKAELSDKGLRYWDKVEGTGKEAVRGTLVTVHYRGWLQQHERTGRLFDASYKRRKPFQFKLGQGRVIQGWDAGVEGMCVGGTRILWIPSKLGYAEMGAGHAVPPNSDLIFEVRLLAVL